MTPSTSSATEAAIATKPDEEQVPWYQYLMVAAFIGTTIFAINNSNK